MTTAIKLIALVLPLGLDTFAVSAAIGVGGLSTGRRLRLSVLMAIFEAGMPLVGLALGVPVGHAVGAAADYVAIVVLWAFGIYTLVDRGDGEDEQLRELGRVTGWSALVLGLSVSLDELAVGFTIGLRLGARVGSDVREGAERLAGLVLIALGLGLLIERIAST